MGRILVVDDEPLNIDILRRHLAPLGHDVFDAGSGEEAIERYRDVAPDLVVMDVMMPGMSGIEAVESLKVLARPHFLPVIMVTALNDVATRKRAFQAGGDDFVTKPFDGSLLKLRVTNLLAQRADRMALAARNTKLAELERFRDEMTALLVHDLKNPAAVILNNVDYARSVVSDADAPQLTEALDDALEGCRRLIRLIGNLLDVARADTERLELNRAVVGVSDLIVPLVQVRALMAQHHGVQLAADVPADLYVDVDPDLLTRMVENILDNALHHTPAAGRVLVSADASAGRLLVRIANTGSTIPEEERELVFDKYGQVKSMPRSRLRKGLGLYFCRVAAEAQGGWIKLEQSDEFPVQFLISIPAETRTHDVDLEQATRSAS
jgi:two-component system sensor histidine kinase/response regulator